MKRYLIIAFLCMTSITLMAQEVHLQMLLDSTQRHYPKYKAFELNKALSSSKITQLKKQNYPQAQLKGKASWQSEVIELPIELPGVEIPSMSQDQYNGSLEIQQAIYQGGLNKAKQASENVDQQIRDTETHTSLYSVRQRVANLYFQVLLLQKQQEVLALHKNTLQSKKEELQALVQEGMLLQQQVDYLDAELISLAQNESSLRSSKTNLLSELSELSGVIINPQDEFILPMHTASSEAVIKRQELELMKLQIEKMEVGKDLTKAQNRPFVYAYATAGYGRPGLNYLSDEFSDYYMLGVQFQWKLWDWNDGKAQREQLAIQQDLVRVQEEEFVNEITISANKMQQEITLLDSLILHDQKLVKLRERIAETSSEKVKNGTLTSSNYVEELNQLKQARLNAQLHEVQRALAKVNYLWIKGIL